MVDRGKKGRGEHKNLNISRKKAVYSKVNSIFHNFVSPICWLNE